MMLIYDIDYIFEYIDKVWSPPLAMVRIRVSICINNESVIIDYDNGLYERFSV